MMLPKVLSLLLVLAAGSGNRRFVPGLGDENDNDMLCGTGGGGKGFDAAQRDFGSYSIVVAFLSIILYRTFLYLLSIAHCTSY